MSFEISSLLFLSDAVELQMRKIIREPVLLTFLTGVFTRVVIVF